MVEIFSKKRGQRGFTLIELLVVIAIIGILATIVLVSLNTARSKARDTRRLSDLRQLALASELYYDDNDAYIIQTTCIAVTEANLGGLTPDYMGALPSDPGAFTNYYYGTDSTGQDYVLMAGLENALPAGSYTTDVYGCDCADNGGGTTIANANIYCIRP